MATSKDKIKPQGMRILVKPLAEVDKTKGGLFIPETAKNKSTEGLVVAMGDGEQETNFTGKWPPFKEGQKILFGKWAGQEIVLTDTDERLYLIGIEEVLARLS